MQNCIGVSVRKKLLQWFPFLGTLHLLLHTGAKNTSGWISTFLIKYRRFYFNVLWEPRIQRAVCDPSSRKKYLKKPTIHLYAVCWNEERIIPYFLKHYDSFVDEFHIYDNGSTDSSIKLLSASPKVTVYSFDTGGMFDDTANLKIKNNVWKDSVGKADFVVVCDMDEFLYHHNLDVVLSMMKKYGFTVLKPKGIQMVSECLPLYDGVSQITELISMGVEDLNNYSKTLLFDPNQVEINFGPGCHRSNPTGKVKIFQSDNVKLLHFKYVDRDEVLRKTRLYRKKFSELNLAKGWGRHYQKNDKEIIAVFDQMLASGKEVILL